MHKFMHVDRLHGGDTAALPEEGYGEWQAQGIDWSEATPATMANLEWRKANAERLRELDWAWDAEHFDYWYGEKPQYRNEHGGVWAGKDENGQDKWYDEPLSGWDCRCCCPEHCVCGVYQDCY